MPRIDTIKLRSLNPKGQTHFYTDILGMGLRDDGGVAYGPAEVGLFFEQAEHAYQPTVGDIYWKIALAVPNIELAYEQLTERGVTVGTPRQFQDVGYLAHFRDPEGFTIELIEHWFQGNRPEIEYDRTRLGGGASLNLLTLRTHDIVPVREDCLAWGMTPLSIQPVLNHGFTLYFFAFTNDQPPNPDLIALENREWLYQRPYTVLEIQERHGASPAIETESKAAGYIETQISEVDFSIQQDQLKIFSGSQ